ncbi:hypothetical protein E2562_023134 [Oryza meyeriana var. granulata]|uniref:Uncharacterized protein n=1 Tax=Oryza meyeriana var. granulata TaxID=110450 RepID=A0A6G1E091_9ORYZ|nr:hypothetical protein E2562_023134 [Oryza meyeriana var. granulata]
MAATVKRGEEARSDGEAEAASSCSVGSGDGVESSGNAVDRVGPFVASIEFNLRLSSGFDRADRLVAKVALKSDDVVVFTIDDLIH